MSAWGDSFGVSWGVSWGDIGVVIVVPAKGDVSKRKLRAIIEQRLRAASREEIEMIELIIILHEDSYNA